MATDMVASLLATAQQAPAKPQPARVAKYHAKGISNIQKQKKLVIAVLTKTIETSSRKMVV